MTLLALSASAAVFADDDCVELIRKKSIVYQSNDRFASSGGMDSCENLSQRNLPYLYGSQKGKGNKEFKWHDAVMQSSSCAKELCDIAKKDTTYKDQSEDNKLNFLNGKYEDALKNANSKCSQVVSQAAQCDAAAYMISAFDRDWTNTDHTQTKDVKGTNPQMTCKGFGIETFDYEACVKFAQNSELMEAAQSAVQTGQELYYKDKTATAQMEAASNTDSATAGLQALKTGVKSQQDMMTQRAALDTAKLATLASFYMDMPERKDLEEKCSGWKSNLSTSDKTFFGDQTSNDGCKVINNKDFAFLQNQQSKEKMKAKLVQVGVNVGSDAVMAGLMAKRAGDLDKAIAKVDAFKPIDPTAPAATDLTSTYCQQNPGDAKCLTGGLDRTFDAMSDNVINFGDGGTGASYNNSNPYTDAAAAASGTGSTTASKGPGTVGSAIVDAGGKSGLANPLDAATVKNGAAPAAGGGGGGGGGSAGGGGGGGLPSSPAQGGVQAAIQGKTPSYNGGSGVSVFGGGGLKGAKSVAKDGENPFKNLLGKDGNKNGALDFGRSPASTKVGSKSDNLFDMISNRYTTVSKDKRLLEYELAK